MGYIKRSFNHLGNLKSRLADLQGFATLAYELVQNAEDSKSATWIRFTLTDDRLVVDNNGSFSSCGALQEPCRLPKPCDFHRFADIGGGEKASDEESIGAFGLGFLSVYQITDQPEVISSGEHWILDEAADEDQRIRTCAGCAECTGRDLPGTRFVLPLATTPSALRTRLGVEPLLPERFKELRSALESALPHAGLFIERLRTFEFSASGRSVLHADYERDPTQAIATINGQAQLWTLLRGSVDSQAVADLATAVGGTEVRRRSEVAIAIAESPGPGTVFAWLPSQVSTDLPFHVHADFFPSNDRKRLLLDQDYRSRWNRECLRAIGLTLTDQLAAVRDHLGPDQFWRMLAALRSLTPAAPLSNAWAVVLPEVRQGPFLPVGDRDWVTASECVVTDDRFAAFSEAIRALGLRQVSEEVSPYRNIIVDGQNGAGVSVFGPTVFFERWHERDVTAVLKRHPSLCEEFWGLIDGLLATPRLASDTRGKLLDLPLFQSGGRLLSASECRRGSSNTRQLFLGLDPTTPFVEDGVDCFKVLNDAIPDFGVQDAIVAIEHCLSAGADLPFKDVLRWVAKREDAVGDSSIKRRLADLAIYPSGQGLRPLTELSLPSDFRDELGLANVADLTDLEDSEPLLRTLGASPLRLETYVQKHLLPALAGSAVSHEVRLAAVRLLADHPRLRDDPALLADMRKLALVPCTSGQFAAGHECYLPGADLQLLVGSLLRSKELESNRSGSRDLYVALGAQANPRTTDLIATLKSVTQGAPNPDTTTRVEAIFQVLADRFIAGTLNGDETMTLSRLEWLPAADDYLRWFAPGALTATFEKHLFESQARFLGLAKRVQESASDFLKALGMAVAASPLQIVKHLLLCAENNRTVPESAYRRLNDAADDPAIGLLAGERCITFGDGEFWQPEHLFWTSHKFGPFRRMIGPPLLEFRRLFDALDVPDSEPDHESAIQVLQEVADGNAAGTPLDSAVLSTVRYCWTLISEALERGALESESLAFLSNMRVVPDRNDALNVPAWLFLEDRAHLAGLFAATLGPNLIPVDRGIAKALEAAGVRRLSQAVELLPIDIGDRLPATDVAARLSDRVQALERVIEGSSLRGQVNQLGIESTATIAIQYEVPMPGRPLRSPALAPAALLIPNEGVLLIRDGEPAWPEIARELSFYFADKDTGPLASALHQVLSAPDLEAAHRLLDQFGYPRTTVAEPAEDVPPSDQIGTKEEQADQPGTPRNDEVSSTRSPSDPLRRATQLKKSRFVTYVAPPGTPAEPDLDSDAKHALRQRVAAAAINIAVQYERDHGRGPLEMPPNNKGYDIESRDSSGTIVRYIEVKGQSGPWGSDGVGMTAPEYVHSQQHGNRSWLYVVEFADTEYNTLHTVRDPAGKPTHYFYDKGWIDVARLDTVGRSDE